MSQILFCVVGHVVTGLFWGEIDLAQDSTVEHSHIKWIVIQEVNSRMRRSSGQRSPLRQPVKWRRPLRRMLWDSQAMLPGGTPRKSRKEPRQARLRSSCIQSGSETLRWPKPASPPCCAHRSRCMEAAIADLAAGHSLVAALRGAGIGRLFMTDWRSASAEMRFLGIDEYLADLNVLVDRVGGLVDLIGLCQGGWLSLVYAGCTGQGTQARCGRRAG